jgi:hypothetical protein
MNELYLILHKVRGEVAFDVAQRVMIGDEEVWFIPTSGHRAWPLQYKALHHSFAPVRSEDWYALRDHYSDKQREGSKARLRARLRDLWKVRAKRDVGEATLPA